MEEPIMKHLYLTILFLLGGMNCVMAQTDHSVAKDTQQNQVQLTLTDGDVKYYNTGDVEKIKFEEKQVKVIQPKGDDVYDNLVKDIAFFKAEKPAGLTKADLVGTWEVKAQEEVNTIRGGYLSNVADDLATGEGLYLSRNRKGFSRP